MKKLWFLFLGIILFLVSLFFDKTVALSFLLFRNPVFDYIALFFSYSLIQGAVFFALPFLILWFKNRNHAIVFCIGFALVLFVTYSLKFIVMRARPFVALDIPLLALASYSFAWFNTSFPSSHASTSFSAFSALERFSKLRWVWLFLGLLVVFSRLYDGVHYLSDVVAGSLLGYFLTYFVFWLDKKYRFSRAWKKIV